MYGTYKFINKLSICFDFMNHYYQIQKNMMENDIYFCNQLKITMQIPNDFLKLFKSFCLLHVYSFSVQTLYEHGYTLKSLQPGQILFLPCTFRAVACAEGRNGSGYQVKRYRLI